MVTALIISLPCQRLSHHSLPELLSLRPGALPMGGDGGGGGGGGMSPTRAPATKYSLWSLCMDMALYVHRCVCEVVDDLQDVCAQVLLVCAQMLRAWCLVLRPTSCPVLAV